MARDGRLISIQVFSRFGGADCREYDLPSPCALTFDSDQLRALERVLELSRSLEIAAVNMSFGGGAFRAPCDDDLLKLAIDELRAAEIAAVVASGNESYDGIVSAPACISSAVAAGSTTKADRISRFSNHAGTVDLLAPGSAIRSSVPGGGFAVFDGTSMAAPHVAGAFALLRDAAPAASIDAIEMALKTTGKRLTRRRISQPRIRVDAALAALLDAAGRPLNDDLGAAVWLAGPRGKTTGSNLGASAQPSEPTHAGVGGGRSVWWRWLAPRGGTARLSTFGSDFDSVLSVYRGARRRRPRRGREQRRQRRRAAEPGRVRGKRRHHLPHRRRRLRRRRRQHRAQLPPRPPGQRQPRPGRRGRGQPRSERPRANPCRRRPGPVGVAALAARRPGTTPPS